VSIPETSDLKAEARAEAWRIAREQDDCVQSLEVSEMDKINPAFLSHAYKSNRQHVTTDDKLREVARLVVVAAQGRRKLDTRSIAFKFGVTSGTVRDWIKKAREKGYIGILQQARDGTVADMSEDREEVAHNVLLAMRRKSRYIADLPEDRLADTSLSECIAMLDRTEHTRKGADVQVSINPGRQEMSYDDMEKRLKEIKEERKIFEKPTGDKDANS
jgi:transposase-like protein